MEYEYWAIILIAFIIWGVVWGTATQAVINNKGYEENWFFWGFFFGFIALIVACAKPVASSVNSTNEYGKLIGNNERKGVSEEEKADAILKYKNLLDVGAITQEEYEKKKNELLDSKVTSIKEIENNDDLEEKQVDRTQEEDSLKDWLFAGGFLALIIGLLFLIIGGIIKYLFVTFIGVGILVVGVVLFVIALTGRKKDKN